MSSISSFMEELISFLLRNMELDLSVCQNAAKQHTDKLKQNGDIGFPTSLRAWSHSSDVALSKKIIDETNIQFQTALIECSRKWSFPIQRIQCSSNLCVLFLDRGKCFENVLGYVLSERQGIGRWKKFSEREKSFNVDVLLNSNNDSLTELRCTLIKNVLINLLKVAGYCLHDVASQSTVKIIVTHTRCDDQKMKNGATAEVPINARKIICGIIKSQENLTATEYIECRAKDMEKMADMKYGNEKENFILYDYVKLGAGIVTFDLLRTKHSNVIPLEQLIAQSTTSKGAAFILYNVARLQSILATFDEHVSSGSYAKLPALDQIDFTLLKEEEEWQLLYVFIDGFPNVLERCLTNVENGRIAIHLLCTYLSSFSALFSIYYHRIKILTDNVPCLVATMNARIYLLQAIRVVFLKALAILGIEPLNQM